MRNTIITLVIIGLYTLGMWQVDNYDRTHPFGTKEHLNKKYTPKVWGEEYGVNVYKGIARKKDSMDRILDKVKYLGFAYQTDIIWRRSLFFAVIFSSLFIIIHGVEKFDVKSVFLVVLCMYMCIYALKQWENAHVNKIKGNHIERNIKLFKRKMAKI